MSSGKTLVLTSENFQTEVLESPIPVLIDFWAEWCGPCKMIAPLIDELADEYLGKARFGKLNIDEQPRLAEQYGIRAIPTLLIIKQGDVVEQIVGGMIRKRELKDRLDRSMHD